MIKIILKNIWSRRRINGWLIAELILITVLAWIMLDPVVEMTYDLSLEKGYDADRLCALTVKVSNDTTLEKANDDQFYRIFDKIKRLPEVENVTLTSFTFPESQGTSDRVFVTNDSARIVASVIYYLPNVNFFETFGIKSAEGYESVDNLSKMSLSENQFIITKSLADRFFPGENAIGKTLSGDSEDEKYEVVGVVEDVRPFSINRNANAVFSLTEGLQGAMMYNFGMMVKVKEGINAKDFAYKFNQNISEFKDGRTYIESAVTYDILTENRNITPMGEYKLKVILLCFFLINLIIGVIGNFWLQTRQRASEVAIMKSFGATRRNIVSLLIGEGTVLTFIAWLIGCIIYLQYALSHGLYMGFTQNLFQSFYSDIADCWVNNFSVHFLIISLIVFAVMWVFVLIGVTIPAVNISKTNTAAALHND